MLVVMLLLVGPLSNDMGRVSAETTCNSAVVVEEGDTCFGIGQKFHTSVKQIRKANPGLDCDNLQVGKQICLS
ncbi:hypothetical protein GOP47_0016601 [Adiantum capillus-veneris]|uniref:LysM domain-containing protein n=1 Tax=Adiantum capillus-veneris TaxID=13818 RepID=A0A9D4UHZ7_ADICA|nr:hypothetical protein GOP47_0016601 [Adiantum capillus-veneris]